MMITRRGVVSGGVTSGLMILATGGCNLTRARASDPPPPDTPTGDPLGEIPGYGPLIRSFGDTAQPMPRDEPLTRAVYDRAASRQRLDLLAISGGGDDGAYGAGFLNGWSKLGTRPEFDAVTGISTGALIAPMAFLGSAYDGYLRDFYTRTEAEDIYRLKIASLLTGGIAAADPGPLARRIEQVISPELVARIAEERRKGRLLLIGTTNLDAQRLVIWDIGRIAASGRPDRVALIRRVILASAAIPGVFPPVTFDAVRNGTGFKEIHVDGGVTRGVFAYPGNLDVPPRAGARNMWVIRNAKLGPEWEATSSTAIGIARRSLSTVLKAQSRGDIAEIQAVAQAGDFDLHLTAVPPNFPLRYERPFEPRYMRTLFATGEAAGLSGRAWGTMAELTGVGE
ncbi:patatin-like phospholipase family protein [Paracoccus marinus]|uniref:patatin-like phospholipase family protein n=1 Tax=Paracoccus marinus TaxID=288426 RepID=UPI00103E613A|nr:patatin-like phospholipase family protein [Paracoccus marinus]GLS79739.1 lipoprotein [Paracoccus marinus]